MRDQVRICDGRKRGYVYPGRADATRNLHCLIAKQYCHVDEREQSTKVDHKQMCQPSVFYTHSGLLEIGVLNNLRSEVMLQN